MKIAYLTAGAAGMYCGSCMHDNALARQLQREGVDCLLLPVYTPIRTDEQDVSTEQVFFGGVHIYLLQKMPLLRYLPRIFWRTLDAPRFLRWATRGVGSTSPELLGDMAVSMLQGRHGKQRDEVDRLATWLGQDLQPDCVILSNLLIGGAIPAIRQACPGASIYVTLQGDDIFIDHLKPVDRERVLELMQGLVRQVDRFIVHSQFYADKMSQLLQIPQEQIAVLPLAIDATPFLADQPERSAVAAAAEVAAEATSNAERTIGYLARLAPEKGLHHLVDAFVDVAKRKGNEDVRLRIAGWQGPQHEAYVEELKGRLSEQGVLDRVHFHGSPDLAGKVEFLKQIDVLCVPTDYHEPKGLFVLEAWATGVPVVQPEHGAFPELLTIAGGGCLVPPGNAVALADQLHALLADAPLRQRLGAAGKQYVQAHATIEQHASKLLQLLRESSPPRTS
ncbi:glycosyltransferase family 4 protein [Roseimaritima ulvae]|uniref:GDP-mannose-dependent alpha-(1-6)-phosphatidylinositol monomannoside mannosyltransferase n=1 Tax=Roseimaritima ulvae TaxID=980254 RepID=A0A5B9QQ29_9BACT|nr:glycosyltransferase family 4 protein [Roseimaritima ulvae]QEG40019.1 GDP-mannose-dependent alpha-(1-6)-phosphatidylinositol monomannoside mannosyltransferase [Roseimaritima ulvae]